MNFDSKWSKYWFTSRFTGQLAFASLSHAVKKAIYTAFSVHSVAWPPTIIIGVRAPCSLSVNVRFGSDRVFLLSLSTLQVLSEFGLCLIARVQVVECPLNDEKKLSRSDLEFIRHVA